MPEFKGADEKLLYGDYIRVNGKPEGEKLQEYVLLLTEQMMRVLESANVKLDGNPVTFVIQKQLSNDPAADEWTIGWKILV